MNSKLKMKGLILVVGIILGINEGQASCLDAYYGNLAKIKNDNVDSTYPIAGSIVACQAAIGLFVPPVLAFIPATIAITAAGVREEFKELARAKRMIQASYFISGQEIPFRDKEKEATYEEKREYLRKFSKYHKKIQEKTGLTGAELANILVQADKKKALCPSLATSPMKYSQLKHSLMNGDLQISLGLELTEKQKAIRAEAAEKAEKREKEQKPKKLKKKKSKGYERID